MRAWFLGGLVFLGPLLAATATVVAQNPTSGGAGPGTKAEPKAPPPVKLETKVFRLEHCDPHEIRSILQQLLDEPEMVAPPAPGVGGQPPMPPGGMMFGMVGGFGMMGGEMPQAWRVTVNPRSAAVIVRGRAKDLQLAADLVAVLDLAEGKPLPKVKTVQAIALKHAKAAELAEIIRDLELPVRIVPLDEAKMIIGAGPEEALRELTNLIQQLDLPERKLDEKKQKKLGVPDGGA